MKAYRYVLTLFRLDRGLVLRFAVTSLGHSATSLAVILLLRDLLAGIVAGGLATPTWATLLGPERGLWVVAAMLWFTFLAGTLLSLDNQVTQQRMVKALEMGLIERLLRHLLGMSVSYFERQSHGDILQAVRADVTELRTVIFGLAKLVLDGVTAMGLLAAAYWLSPRLTFWALVVMPLSVIPVVVAARRVLAHARTIRKTGYVLVDAILELLHGIRLIKVFQAEGAELSATLDKSRQYFDERIIMVRTKAFGNAILQMITRTGIVIVVVLGGLDVMAGRLDWPTLLAFLFAARALHGPLNSLSQSVIMLATHGASAERVADFLQHSSDVTDPPDPVILPAAPRVIEVDRVNFGYQGAGRLVLTDVSFTLPAGGTLGIVGPSGAGKSTLLGLVARFFDPVDGCVTMDGVDLRRVSLSALYDRIAIVTQAPFLFAATIRENIRCGRPGASDQEVEDAARIVGVHEEILQTTQGYDTLVGLGGTALSGGQAQRVNVARALLKNPAILLLDEATSSLDSVAEVKVQAALERLMDGRTTLVVAHRLSTLRHVDRILVLEAGRVAGLGTHQELLESCPLYRRMWELQLLDPPDSRPSGAMADAVSSPPEGLPDLEPSPLSDL